MVSYKTIFCLLLDISLLSAPCPLLDALRLPRSLAAGLWQPLHPCSGVSVQEATLATSSGGSPGSVPFVFKCLSSEQDVPWWKDGSLLPASCGGSPCNSHPGSRMGMGVIPALAHGKHLQT